MTWTTDCILKTLQRAQSSILAWRSKVKVGGWGTPSFFASVFYNVWLYGNWHFLRVCVSRILWTLGFYLIFLLVAFWWISWFGWNWQPVCIGREGDGPVRAHSLTRRHHVFGARSTVIEMKIKGFYPTIFLFIKHSLWNKWRWNLRETGRFSSLDSMI